MSPFSHFFWGGAGQSVFFYGSKTQIISNNYPTTKQKVYLFRSPNNADRISGLSRCCHVPNGPVPHSVLKALSKWSHWRRACENSSIFCSGSRKTGCSRTLAIVGRVPGTCDNTGPRRSLNSSPVVLPARGNLSRARKFGASRFKMFKSRSRMFAPNGWCPACVCAWGVKVCVCVCVCVCLCGGARVVCVVCACCLSSEHFREGMIYCRHTHPSYCKRTVGVFVLNVYYILGFTAVEFLTSCSDLGV